MLLPTPTKTPPAFPPAATSGIAGFRSKATASVGSAVAPTPSPAALIPVPAAAPPPAAAMPPLGDALGEPAGIPGSTLLVIGAAGAATALHVVRGTLGRRSPPGPRSFDEGETLHFQ
jgi:hypothetical protein